MLYTEEDLLGCDKGLSERDQVFLVCAAFPSVGFPRSPWSLVWGKERKGTNEVPCSLRVFVLRKLGHSASKVHIR